MFFLYYLQLDLNNNIQFAQEAISSDGAMIHSSQWVGWVPGGNCHGGGGLGSSTFSVENVRIFGKVVQGKHPRQC